ncbi:glyoxalase/bleomycin resistance protein/dioxygenase [Tricladium varicosporioides]|nr:glyoxalase/bleomycin resistance protein/dioxygenase [Hymenoscyphus varicosporioides]
MPQSRPSTLRVARPTKDLKAIIKFYTQALDMKILSSFENHNGFDGVMLGPKLEEGVRCDWHLEFTFEHDNPTINCTPPSAENLLVFYEPDKETFEKKVKRVEEYGGVRVKSHNPWWDNGGATFQDPEGWRVVIFNECWGK